MTPLAVAALDWSPRLDRDFKGQFLNALILSPGVWFHPTDLFITDDPWQKSLVRQVAYDAVVAARRCGLEIAGDRGAGYCFVRYELPRYVHTHEQAEDRATAPAAGQLRLVEGV